VSESARAEVLAKAFRLGAVLFGFKEMLLTNREAVNEVCERLFEMYNVEQKPPVESDEYYKLCIELVLKDEATRETFYCFGLLRILP
jgi:hypothetical protein